MLKPALALTALLSALGGVGAAQTLPPVPIQIESPWNGDWVLSQTRNSADIKAAAADGYRFQLQPNGRIRWEIPSLHEVVEGRRKRTFNWLQTDDITSRP